MIRVTPIQNGIVIDHLPANTALNVVQLLELEKYSEVMSLGLNLHSKKSGRKDIIKIEGRSVSDFELQKIALYAPNATVSIIENEHVVQKIKPQLPKVFVNTLVCPNKNCVTNHEYMNSEFEVLNSAMVRLRCKYCERIFPISGMKLAVSSQKL